MLTLILNEYKSIHLENALLLILNQKSHERSALIDLNIELSKNILLNEYQYRKTILGSYKKSSTYLPSDVSSLLTLRDTNKKINSLNHFIEVNHEIYKLVSRYTGETHPREYMNGKQVDEYILTSTADFLNSIGLKVSRSEMFHKLFQLTIKFV